MKMILNKKPGGDGQLAHLSHSEDKVHGRMLRVDAFQLHPLFEAVLHCRHSLGLEHETTAKVSVQQGDGSKVCIKDFSGETE